METEKAVKAKTNRRDKVECKICGKGISIANLAKHQRTKKCKRGGKSVHDDKTVVKSPPLKKDIPVEKSDSQPEATVSVLHSNLTEINLNGEFQTMSEKFNGSKKDEDKEKKYKYKCGECGEYFNIPAEGNKCPFCGQ